MKWNLYISTALALCLATLGLETGNFRRPKTVLAAEKITNNTTFNRWTAQASTEQLLAECRPCPDGKTESRGGQSDRIPYIISPRNTYLLTNRPTLRWNLPIQGAKSYTVRLISLSLRKDIWHKENVTDNKLAYPPDAPPLQPGIDYSLIIKVEGGLSSNEEESSVKFRVLDGRDADDVRSAADLISQQQLPEETKSILLAYLYSGYYLRAEAIELLKPLATNSQTPAVHRLLGDLYRQVGLASIAEPYYLKAVQLANAVKQLEELAAAQAGLGEVYVTLGNKEKAIANLKGALEIYERLNNQQRILELKEQIIKFN